VVELLRGIARRFHAHVRVGRIDGAGEKAVEPRHRDDGRGDADQPPDVVEHDAQQLPEDNVLLVGLKHSRRQRRDRWGHDRSRLHSITA
jgi:hypothetical protein